MTFTLENWPLLLKGAGLTLQLAIGAFFIGALLALPLALLRIYGNKLASGIVRVLISFLRGTPMLAQLFLVYYGAGQFRPQLQALGLWTFLREPYFCALLTFTLNTAAYQAEILRGSIRAVPAGEVEAAKAISMSFGLQLRRIICPHAYRIAMPALGNELILMIKGSAIASVVTLLDLMGQARLIFARTFDFGIYLQAAILYLVISFAVVRLWRLLEWWSAPQFRRPAPTSNPATTGGQP